MITDSEMRAAAAAIADEARENHGGVDVISVGPLFAEPGPGGVQYSAVVIVSERGGKDFVPSFVMLDIAQDPFMATVYRTALIVALKEFFGRVQIFGDPLTLATAKKSGQASAEIKLWPRWCAIAR